jgi:predicted nucleic acid-binding protein
MMIYLDSNIIIYFVENPPVFGAAVQSRLSKARTAGDTGAVSDAARFECLVLPF